MPENLSKNPVSDVKQTSIKNKENTVYYERDFFQKIGKLVRQELETNKNKRVLTKYTQDQVSRMLENPESNEKQLRELVRFLSTGSGIFRRIVLYISTLPNYHYVLKPTAINFTKTSVEEIQKQAFEISYLLEKMDIPDEFEKITKIIFREDVFYGYEFEEENSYSIAQLDPDYCRISGRIDGSYVYEFDFGFFDRNKELLHSYPSEFRLKYQMYQKDRSLDWQQIDHEKSICIKLNTDLDFVYPPFALMIESIFDLDDYRQLDKDRTKLDNYMILVHRIPFDDKAGEMDRFLINPETALAFHSNIEGQLPDEIALATTPMEIDAIRLEKSSSDKDRIATATRGAYDQAGISQFLFNSDKNTSIGLRKSIKVDEQLIFSLLRQFERWLNRKLKVRFKNPMFKVSFLDSTKQNEDELREALLKEGQYGNPIRIELGAMRGHTPLSLMNKAYFETKILKLDELFVPLSSSHTSSDKDGKGRPEKDDDSISDSGQTNKDNDTNEM